MRVFYGLVVVALLLTLLPARGVVADAPMDYDIPNGHFYQQANGQGGAGNTGFGVTDNDNVLFWTWFRRLGGVQSVGYPVSHRFQWKGFTVQAFQKVVFQWRPESGSVMFVNLFDEMSAAGKDDWLYSVRMTPKAFDWSSDTGKPWGQVMASHLAILDRYPAIKAAYYAQAGDPVTMNGLPMAVQEFSNAIVVRAQRKVFQQWTQPVPWAAAGQVTVSNGGDIGKESGLYSADAIIPRAWNQPGPVPTAVPAPTAVPTAAPCPRPVINGFWVNPGTITQGQSATLSWGLVQNANDVSIDNGIGGIGTPGSRSVSPSSSVVYTMRAVGPCGTTTATAAVNVIQPQPRPVPQVQLVSPATGSQVSLPTRLQWNSVASPGSPNYTYTIDIEYNLGSFWAEYTVQSGISGTSFSLPLDDILIDRTVRWRVWATDTSTGATGPSSDEWGFQTLVLPR